MLNCFVMCCWLCNFLFGIWWFWSCCWRKLVCGLRLSWILIFSFFFYLCFVWGCLLLFVFVNRYVLWFSCCCVGKKMLCWWWVWCYCRFIVMYCCLMFIVLLFCWWFLRWWIWWKILLLFWLLVWWIWWCRWVNCLIIWFMFGSCLLLLCLCMCWLMFLLCWWWCWLNVKFVCLVIWGVNNVWVWLEFYCFFFVIFVWWVGDYVENYCYGSCDWYFVGYYVGGDVFV